MGGRGQGIRVIMPSGATGTAYDLTDKYKDYTLKQYENAIRNRKSEYVGIFDNNGKLVYAGTSRNAGSVAFPSDKARGADTLTHNHPYYGGRTVGGTFSGEDVMNHSAFGMRQTRAVSNGPNENTYILRNRAGSRQNSAEMFKYAARNSNASGNPQRIMSKAWDNAQEKAQRRGKSVPESKRGQVELGSLKQVWKSKSVSDYGYEYIEIKKKGV